MSRVYDNWERLVEATLKRELLRELALCPSFDSSISDDFSSRFSFDCLDFNELPVEEMVFSVLKEKTDNFGLNALIGDGYYGRVYLAQLNGGDVAAQRLDVSYKSDHEFFTQVSTLSSLKHENIVELIGYCVEGNIRILAYEFAAMGSLYDILHGRKGPVLDWMQRVRIALDIARALAYLHEKVHLRDIRSSSVLLFKDYKAKVADFNFTNQAPGARTLSTYVRETNTCRAPEYARTGQLTEKTNIYSFGVVLLELFTGKMYIDYTRSSGHTNLVIWATPKLSEDKIKQCIDPKLMEVYPPKAAARLAAIAASCVQFEPEFRVDISIVVKALEVVLKQSQAFVSAPAPAPAVI